MAKRTVELDEERMETEGQHALEEAETRAERAEAELARLRRAQGLHEAAAEEPRSAGRTEGHGEAEGEVARQGAQGAEKTGGAHHGRSSHGQAAELEGDLFAGQEAGATGAAPGYEGPEDASLEDGGSADGGSAEGRSAGGRSTDGGSGGSGSRERRASKEGGEEMPAERSRRVVGRTIEQDRQGGGQVHAEHERGREHARHGRVDPEDDPGNASEVKDAPTRSSAEGESEMEGGEEELRKDSMMAHLLDSLDEGKDIGHYGRLVFAMVARHFLPHAEVMARLTKDRDFGEEDAELMLRQVEGRDYSPPKRAKILEYQREQEFPILPNLDDPDCGNLYRNLKLPDAVYKHIGHYQEQKMEAGE